MNKETEVQMRNVVEFEGLSKDDKKAVNAYNNTIQKGLSVFKGEPLKPLNKIPGAGMEKLIDEFLGEEIKELEKEFKAGFKEVLVEKGKLDAFIKQQQQTFNKAVVAQKKAFTQKANKVLNIVDGIEALRNNYMEALGDVDNKEEEQA